MVARGVWHTRTCGECGLEFEAPDYKVRAGRGKYCSRSCGNAATSRRHGHTTNMGQSRTYNSWASMIQRCTNPKSPKFSTYGGSGVYVCDRWLDFTLFLADMGEKPIGTSIDRVDGAKGYEPGNCRWATPREQSDNIRTNVRHEFQGERLTQPQIARRLGVNISTLRYRMRQGWPQERWGVEPSANH